jgi:hypothetical protein
MRYARVQLVLEQERAFVAKMGTRTETVFKPDGEKQLFSPQVIAVTQAIHNSGKDAHKVHKTEIVRVACQVFRIGRSAPTPETNGAVVAHPQPPAELAPAPAQATPVVVSKPAKAPQKSPPKPKAKQKAKQAPAPAPEPLKVEEPTTKPPAPTAEVDNREAVLAKTKEVLNPERPGENQAAFNAFISMYSMSLTLLQLVEIYDNQPGKDKRYQTLDNLAKEFNKYTSIKSAKEAQKAQS